MNSKMIEQFMEMVQIDSESGNEAKFISYVKEQFELLGADAITDNYGNLIAKINAKNCQSEETILLSCHGDTVQPGIGIEPILEDGVIRSKGETILGADDKAGIAEMLQAIREAEIHPPLEIAITREEEVGLLGVKNLDYSKITAKTGYLLDNDVLDTIIIGGPTYYAIDVNIEGKSAHAGMEPEKGINAIQAAANIISNLELGRIDDETTANVGKIEGGLIRNGVPDNCNFIAECRSLNHSKAEQLVNKMKNIITEEGEKNGAKVTIKIDKKCEAVEISPNSEVVKICQEALRKFGIEAKPVFMTGFTDASIHNNNGIEMAGIGIGAKLEHSTNEHIYVKDMEIAKNVVKEIFRISANRR